MGTVLGEILLPVTIPGGSRAGRSGLYRQCHPRGLERRSALRIGIDVGQVAALPPSIDTVSGRQYLIRCDSAFAVLGCKVTPPRPRQLPYLPKKRVRLGADSRRAVYWLTKLVFEMNER